MPFVLQKLRGALMGEKFAAEFYHSAAWARCRKLYAKSKGGLCERCEKRGLIVPGVEVHHKVRLTPENLHDTSITLNWGNLELLCEACHAAEHQRARWRTDSDGRILW